MASLHQKLAESLEVLQTLQARGVVAVRSGDLTGTHRERLVKDGFLQEVMKGENPGAVSDDDHGDWYREMFGPSVVAGLLRPADLAGCRNNPVYIRRSMHVPPRYEAVRDCMPTFFDLLREEPEPGVRVVLGHVMFVCIHPYIDGNGRIGRFLMNVMFAAGGYPWIVIPIEIRDDYMNALESGSVKQDTAPFAAFLGSLVSERLEGKQVHRAPARTPS